MTEKRLASVVVETHKYGPLVPDAMNIAPGRSDSTVEVTTARWVLYACRSSYAAEVLEIVWRRGETVEALVDNLPEAADEPAGSRESIPPTLVLKPGDLVELAAGFGIVIPLITPGHRHRVEIEARGLGLTNFPVLVDPTAVIARSARMGEGTVVNAAVVVGANTRLGRFVSINRSASIGHDDDIADYVTLGPACVLAGQVRVGRGAFVGAGAICAPNVRIGENAIVGAGAVVAHDVPDGAVMFGNPARVLRKGDTGYGGVAVS